MSSGSCLELFAQQKRPSFQISLTKESSENIISAAQSSQVSTPVKNFKAVPFTSCFYGVNDYVQIMVEDLAAWLNDIYHIELGLENFLESLDNGVLLCQHANNLQRLARSYAARHPDEVEKRRVRIPTEAVAYRPQVPRGTFLGAYVYFQVYIMM